MGILLKNKFVGKVIFDRLSLFIVSLLAFCVSLGTALVSISKALLLATVLCSLIVFKEKLSMFKLKEIPIVFKWMTISVAWMLTSMYWSQASVHDQWKYFYGHTRFLWILPIYYLIQNKERGLCVLKWLIYGQIFVVACSLLMWLGIEVPFTKRPLEQAAAFTSTVMTTLVLLVLWAFRDYWTEQWGVLFFRSTIVLMGLDVIFVMSGRTGYLAFLTLITIEAFRGFNNRMRWVAVLTPFLLATIFYNFSPIFAQRVGQIKNNSQAYIAGEVVEKTSEGQRLDMWTHTLLGIGKKPILGYGVGSLPEVYLEGGGTDSEHVSQPHQQYLFWWAEFGFIGLVIMLGFFFSLMKDASKLDKQAKSSLISVISVLFVMGMFNCPFFGVGMGEFFFLEIAALLTIREKIFNGFDKA
jgi:O-antigen ligase